MDRLNKGLMTLASYRAGPGRVRQLRAETARAAQSERLVRQRRTVASEKRSGARRFSMSATSTNTTSPTAW